MSNKDKLPPCHPYESVLEMPLHKAVPRFAFSFLFSRGRSYLKRLYSYFKNPPLHMRRFEIFNGVSAYEKSYLSLKEALPHAEKGKTMSINSRLSEGMHCIMLDWDGITLDDVAEWIEKESGRWHVYQTLNGFHFICSSRKVTYWQMAGIHQRSNFHKEGKLFIILRFGHFCLRVTRKRPRQPDKFKVGVFGKGGEHPEILEVIELHDQLMHRFHAEL
jgi:hypothetical protein